MEHTSTSAFLTLLILAVASVISTQPGAADDKNAQAASVSDSDNGTPRLVRRYVPQFIGKREPASEARELGNEPGSEADADQELSENELSEHELLELLNEYENEMLGRAHDKLDDFNEGSESDMSEEDDDDIITESDSNFENTQEEKRYVPSFVGKRYVPSFVGKRYVPSFVGKRYVPSFVGKRYVPSFVGKRYVPSFVGKRYVPSFVGKRYVPSFVGKRYVPSFVGKRYVPSFVGRKRYQPTFVGKRYVPSFVGKRYQPMFVGKRYQPTFVGKRESYGDKRYRPMFVGKRYVPSFVGKRSTLDGAEDHLSEATSVTNPAVHVEKRSATNTDTMATDDEVNSRHKRSLMEMESKRIWGRDMDLKDILAQKPIGENKRFVAPEFVGRRDSISTILSALKALQVARSEPRLATKRFQAPLFIGKRTPTPGDSSLYWKNTDLDPLTAHYLSELEGLQL